MKISNRSKKNFVLIICFLLGSMIEIKAQQIVTGIYASPGSDASTYVELAGEVLHTTWAGKYDTNYKKTSSGGFLSEDGERAAVIENEKSITISNVASGKSTTLTLQLALPKLDEKKLIPIDLPSGKGFITHELPFDVTGSYKFDGSANVITQLNADGTGKFQYAESSDQAGTLFDIRWGVLCNNAGQYLANSLGGVHAFTLMIYTTKWEGVSLQYSVSSGRIVVNRDRFKDK